MTDINVGNDSVSNSQVTHDPGWNDPPVFSYDETRTAGLTPRKGPNLKKRVAHSFCPQQSDTGLQRPPMQSRPPSSSSTAEVPSPGPPIHTTCASIPDPAITSNSMKKSDKESAIKSGAEMLSDIMTTFNDVLNSSPESKRGKEEIEKRLNLLKKMWEEDKFKPDIHEKLFRLSEALKSGNAEAADTIQAGLMVDHVTLCCPWMAGVRKLIHHMKETAPPKVTSDTDMSVS